MSTLHRGLLVPFRRDKKSDFASASGEQLLASKIRQALLSEGDTPRSSGELPWRTAFGAALGLLRFQRNGTALCELARVYVTDSLRRWVPSAVLVSLQIEQVDSCVTLAIRVQEDFVHADVRVPIQTI